MNLKRHGQPSVRSRMAHRAAGWWVVCVMAGLAAHPASAADAGEVSRAVEVSPPKGWTPDTPLFHEEASGASKEAARTVAKEEGSHAPATATPPKPLRRLVSATGEETMSARRVRDLAAGERVAGRKQAPRQERERAPENAKAGAAKTHTPDKLHRDTTATRRVREEPLSAPNSTTRHASNKSSDPAFAKAKAVTGRSNRPSESEATSRTRPASKHAAQDHGRTQERAKPSQRLLAAKGNQPASGAARFVKANQAGEPAKVDRLASTHRKATGAAEGRPSKEKKVARGEKAEPSRHAAAVQANGHAKQLEQHAHMKNRPAAEGKAAAKLARQETPRKAPRKAPQRSAKRPSVDMRSSTSAAKKG